MRRITCLLAALTALAPALHSETRIDSAPEYGGNVRRLIIDDADRFISVADTVYIALPDGYDASGKYRTVYLLHGLGAHPTTYLQYYGTADAARDLNMILVHVNAHKDMWYLNAIDPSEPQYCSYFFDRLLPEISSSFAVDTDKTFLCGMSMGGHGAVTLFERHPELFAGTASISGCLELVATISGRPSIERMLGDYADGSNMEWHRNSALHNIERIAVHNDKLILISCGTDDPLFNTSMDFMKRCLRLNVEAEFHFGSGAHNSEYWHKELPYVLKRLREN